MVVLMTAMIASAALAEVPGAYELDFRMLPAANTFGYYEFTVILRFNGEPDVKIPFGFGKTNGPKEVTDSVMDCLGDPRWKLKRDGARVTVYGYDDVRIVKATVEGKGPQPLVRRVLVAPPEKK
jgi:hypothetical protein